MDAFVQTTNKTIADFRQLDDESSLPQTYRDAILVTREMSLAYLWIDAFCIIQGDAKDWAEQSQKMADICGRAHVTIAASTSKRVADGFLGPRTGASAYCGILSTAAGERKLMLRPLVLINYEPPISREPLESRGWAVQERMLSQRTLYFCRDQVVWECDAMVALEADPSSEFSEKRVFHSLSMNDEGNSGLEEGTQLHDTIQDMTRKDLDTNQWQSLIRIYSKCKLTKFSDRLPALSGLAMKFAKAHETYIAGHWLENLPAALTWRGVANADAPTPVSCSPSWAWSTFPGPVQSDLSLDPEAYSHTNQQLQMDRHEGLRITSVVNLTVHHTTANKFGEVSYGEIQLMARLC